MKLSEIYNKKKRVMSCEIFPPKPETDIETIYETIESINDLGPDFISVTYGAGGSNSERTLEVTAAVKEKYGIEPLMHLTCVGNSTKEIQDILDDAAVRGIENVLALRGDIPGESGRKEPLSEDLCYASDLVEFINKSYSFSIGVAGYPEGHPEAADTKEDIKYLKVKTDAGADFIITQLFFDNSYFYRYRDALSAAKIDLPVSAGIMPMFKKQLVKKMVFMCGATIPRELENIIEKYGDSDSDMEKAGIDYASLQISDLMENGVEGIHLYTMNRSKLARKILSHADMVR
ncbi:MAG: methylenetetrahydrofolate reductase [NAD(P)H] [Elusimicrobiota bacterium]|nr:methylenetetrahydrofolate reductase [NAD(P)H] [Elusimicrobiota bacterium]